MCIARIYASLGISVFGTKGASARIQDVVREFVHRGRDVEIYAVRMGDRIPADLADASTVEYPLDTGGMGGREHAQTQVPRVIAQRATKSVPDLVWKYYSLFSTALASLMKGDGVRRIFGANAPLTEEQRRRHCLNGEVEARSALVEQSGVAYTITCMSDPMCAWVEKMTDVERVHTVPNGVGTDRITPVAEEAGRAVATFVSMPKSWRGVEYLVGVCALVSPLWDLRIIGDNPQREAFKEAAHVAGVDMDFCSTIAPHEASSHLEGFAVTAAPYPAPADEADHYFSPLEAYEHMAAGLPAIASVLGRIPVTLLGYGVLVPPSDTAVFACVINALARDPGRRTELGVWARLVAEKRHPQEGVVGRTPELVEV